MRCSSPAIVPVLFTLLVNINPSKDVHILWFVFPAGINALTALVSFGVSGSTCRSCSR